MADEIKKKDGFSKWFATLLTIYGCGYLWMYTWHPPQTLGDSKLILGFVMGTMLGAAITWSIGTSKSSADKTELMNMDKGA